MNRTPQISGSLSRIVHETNRGIVPLVDDLLAVCRDEALQIEWQENLIRVRSINGDQDESLCSSLPESAFRAALARVAALCNAQKPGSVSPYGGTAELCLGSNPQKTIKVTFVNSTTEQRLELSPGGRC